MLRVAVRAQHRPLTSSWCAQVRQGMVSLSQLILGSNSLVQAVVPFMLKETPQEHYTKLANQLEEQVGVTPFNPSISRDACATQAMVCVELLSKVPGLNCIKPQSTMYLMVRSRPLWPVLLRAQSRVMLRSASTLPSST
jgi:aspartate/methionine/tyrosine aminotransferase